MLFTHPHPPGFCLKGFICLTIPLTVLALYLCPCVPRSLCVGGDGVVSREESIGFSTPAVGQLPWQQGQRVPTATADAVTEGEGLRPLVQASSPVCCVSTFALCFTLTHILVFQVLRLVLMVPTWNLWALHHTLQPRPFVLIFSLLCLLCSLKSEVLLCLCCCSPYHTPPHSHLPVVCHLS